MKATPKIDTTGEFNFVVGSEHIITFAGDGMPAVLSTPSLIGLIEHSARGAHKRAVIRVGGFASRVARKSG